MSSHSSIAELNTTYGMPLFFPPDLFILPKRPNQYPNISYRNVNKIQVNNQITNKLAALLKSINEHKLKLLLFNLLLVSISLFIYINKSHYKQHISFQLFDGYNKYQVESEKFKNSIQKKSLQSSFLK